MRDGIYKNAPVTAHWRRLIKACQNDAAWDADGHVRATQAVQRELQVDHLRPARLKKLLQAITLPDGLLPSNELLQARLVHWSKECTPRERQVLEHLGRISAQGTPLGLGALVDSVEAVLREIPRSHLRAIDGYLAEKFPAQRQELLTRLKSAVADIPFRGQAEELSRGIRPKMARLNNKPLDIDNDDLR